MTAEFVQVTATKPNCDFMISSNLRLMVTCGITPAEAFARLVKFAQEYAGDGYDVKWTREALSEFDMQLYGDLFHG